METSNDNSSESKTPIIVALIGSTALVMGALIANWDKIRSTEQAADAVAAEIGHSEARAARVDKAFQENEVAIESQWALALRLGSPDIARGLKDIQDKQRRRREKVRELHINYTDAMKNGDRLQASKVRTAANEEVWEANRDITQFNSQSSVPGSTSSKSSTSTKPLPSKSSLFLYLEQEERRRMRQLLLISPYGRRKDERRIVEPIYRITET